MYQLDYRYCIIEIRLPDEQGTNSEYGEGELATDVGHLLAFMDRTTTAVATFFALAMTGLSAGICYTAIEGLVTGKVYILSKLSPGRYETGIPGVILAVSYLVFSVGLAFGAVGIFITRKGDIFMSWFKKAAILAGIILVGYLFAHFSGRTTA
jgi:hypothetical protein